MTLAPALYGNIESYAYKPPAGIEKTYMDPDEARGIISGVMAVHEDPSEEDQPDALQARREAWKASQGNTEAE